MYFSDKVKLRKINRTSDSDGYDIKSITEREVWADRHSVKRTEFYAAQNVGIKTDIAFTVRIEDYDNETELSYNGTIYDIVRTYETDSENIDLTCADRRK